MPQCVFNRQTGLYVRGAQNDAPAFDDVTEVLITLPAYPERRTVRWDGATGTRLATAQELTAVDDADRDAAAQGDFDTFKLAAAMAVYWREQLNVVRAALPTPLPPLSIAAVRQAIIDRYKALP